MVLQILRWSKKYALPGFGGVPIFTIVQFLYNESMNDRLMTRANSIAFNLMLAIFPALIFLLTLLPYVPFADDYTTLLMESLQGVMPQTAHAYLNEIIKSITDRPSGGLLSLGFILAMIFSSNGMLSLMAAFNKRTKKNKSFFKNRGVLRERLLALILTIAIGLLFIISLIMIVAGGQLISLINIEEKLPLITQVLIFIGKWIATFLIIYIGVTIIYSYAPKFRKRIDFVNPGSVMATILSLLTSIGFSYIVNEFGRYNELYGSFGALIVIMIWLQINAFIILSGYELNASIALNQNPANLLNPKKKSNIV